MSTFKKLLALTLALAMVLSVSAFAGYKADTYKDAASIDEDCEDAIELLYALDIMKGDANGNFNPTATITRAEMAKMIYVVLNYGKDDLAVNYKGAKFFSDVVAGAWYEGYVNYAATIKLVQGRGNGTFGPNDPITTAEAAKMLLTAIGYSAADRGYTGAGWAQNVLSDAAILELLDGYNYSTTGYAPRQWVAVMFVNALGAYTFDTIRPVISGGLLTSVNADQSYIKMGQKYLKYAEYEGYLVAANGYYIDGTRSNFVDSDGYFTADFFIYDTSAEEYVGLDGDVSIEDLGQHFKIIAVKGDAISIRNTGKSVVAEDEVKDVTSELTYATSSNNYKNIYEFTVGDLTGKLNGGKSTSTVNVLDVKAGNDKYESMTAATLKSEIDKAGTRNDVVRAIDKDGDGDIDYVIYTPVEYAVITKAATSNKYGDYVKATSAAGVELKFGNPANASLYLDSCIITDDELVAGNYVKFTWNIDAEKYNVEVLDVLEAADFDSRKVTKNEYTFDGETYNIAANAFTGIDRELGKAGILGDAYDIVVDGDLLVYAEPTDGSYKSMDEINEHLAVLIKADYRNSDDENTKQVKLLTIDGEIAWYSYDNAAAKKNANNGAVVWSDLFTFEVYAEDKTLTTWDKLYIKHETDDGLWLEAINASDAADQTQMDTTLFDKFVDRDDKTLDVDGGKAKYDSKRVPADYKFFAYVDDEYTVITMADLEDGDYADVDAKYALVKEGTYYDTIVGGYFRVGDAVVAEDGYLFVTEIYEKETADATTILALINGSEEEIEIELSDSSVQPNLNNCYYYEYDGEVYTLTAHWDGDWAEMQYADDELWYVKGAGHDSIDFDDYDVFALKTIESLRNNVDGTWEVQNTTVEFTTAEDLLAAIAECEAMLEADNETYSFKYSFIEGTQYMGGSNDDILYVQIDMYMVDNAD